jgi:hypothetical protein
LIDPHQFEVAISLLKRLASSMEKCCAQYHLDSSHAIAAIDPLHADSALSKPALQELI